MPEKKLDTGLALGGGVVLGAAHIGVLKALEESDRKIDCLAGTSIGAMVAALSAFGKNWKEIREMALEMNWLDVSGLSLSRYGLLSNNKLGKLIQNSIGDVTFDQAERPLAVVTTDITSGRRVVLQEGKVAEAVMASSCIPGMFKPVTLGNRMLVDGGVVENVPITPLQEMGAKSIIGVDLNAHNTYRKPKNIADVLLNSFDMVIRNATRFQTRDADILIAPDLSDFNRFDTDQAADLIEAGYRAAREKLENQ